MDEAKFKQQLRKSFLERVPTGHEWPVTDSFRCGTADFFLSAYGCVMACEAKFIHEFPKRETTPALKHPVSGPQIRFLTRYRTSGSPALVIIGVGGDAAVYTGIYKPNYTRREILEMPRFGKIGSDRWDMNPILNMMVAHARS